MGRKAKIIHTFVGDIEVGRPRSSLDSTFFLWAFGDYTLATRENNNRLKGARLS